MAKADKNNKKKKKTGNESATDLPDIKTNAPTEMKGKSMKTKI